MAGAVPKTAVLQLVLVGLLHFPRSALSVRQWSASARALEAAHAQEDPVPGYVAHEKRSCGSVTIDQGRMTGDVLMQCRQECETAKACQCFEVAGNRCRIAVKASHRTKSGGRGVAYVRDPNYVDPRHLCRKGEFRNEDGHCHEYLECEEGKWIEKRCTGGLAFNPRRNICDWPTNVPGCAGSADELPEIGCGTGRSFYLAGENMPAMQEWLEIEMGEWWKFVGAHPEIKSRPEGYAAISILRATSIELTEESPNITTSRWAAFTKDGSGQLVMQAIALVEEAGNSVNVMAIVSRRTLINDRLAKGGAGKGLLSGILRTVAARHPDEPLTLLGVPGDEFVEKMYRAHGMEEYGREETGMPKLRITYPAECMPYITEKILCQEMDFSDYFSIAWRLIPGSSYFKKTCAHLMPPNLFLKQLGRMVGVA